jgi:hypothetical protein
VPGLRTACLRLTSLDSPSPRWHIYPTLIPAEVVLQHPLLLCLLSFLISNRGASSSPVEVSIYNFRLRGLKDKSKVCTCTARTLQEEPPRRVTAYSDIVVSRGCTRKPLYLDITFKLRHVALPNGSRKQVGEIIQDAPPRVVAYVRLET